MSGILKLLLTSTGIKEKATITSGVSSVNEGSSITFTITTTNVSNGTVLYWTNNGNTSGGDFTDGQNSGTITINSGTATLTRTLVNDLTTEGTETIVINVRLQSTSGPSIGTGPTITVGDTSLTPPPASSVEYVVVAGGGGGGYAHAGGGGGGGYRSSVSGELSGRNSGAESPLAVQTGTWYYITIGGGGSSPGSRTPAGNGSNSSFHTITAAGGGGGGSGDDGQSGNTGGSGGGGGSGGPGGGGTSGQGFDGGPGYGDGADSWGGGGGGGAGGGGGSRVYGRAGNGGSGIQSSITGSGVYRAGGGGGGGISDAPFGNTSNLGGYGGAGGGGNGGNNENGISEGGTNTGGGGGGGQWSDQAGRNGGSGIVIVRFPSSCRDAVGYSGTQTITATHKIYTFTSSGQIQF